VCAEDVASDTNETPCVLALAARSSTGDMERGVGANVGKTGEDMTIAAVIAACARARPRAKGGARSGEHRGGGGARRIRQRAQSTRVRAHLLRVGAFAKHLGGLGEEMKVVGEG
jgi:hypothetical protein